MTSDELKESRKKMFGEMEQILLKRTNNPEDRLFYHHSSEERIVLSHALFWVMTQSLKGKITKEKYYLLLRNYEEKMLEAYLTEDGYFTEMLHYCNILYESMPIVLNELSDHVSEKATRQLAVIGYVAAGFAGDMPEEMCHELLDDIDFYYNKVKCKKIEQMLPRLNEMVSVEMRTIRF